MTDLLRVVDYSKFQGTVSRASHRAMREDGIAGVVVGLWHGLDANPYALNSLANAKDEGLLRGGYVVVNDRPGRDAVRAAQQVAGGHWPQLFGVAIDVEIRGVTEAILADAFDEVERLGQRPFLYTGNWFWNWWALELGHFPDASRYGAWIAVYNGIADLTSVPPRPGYGPIVGHQYRGSTSAYGTTVDFNVFNAAWARAWPQPPPVAEEDDMPLTDEDKADIRRIMETVFSEFMQENIRSIVAQELGIVPRYEGAPAQPTALDLIKVAVGVEEAAIAKAVRAEFETDPLK